jgi:hypothetical protein
MGCVSGTALQCTIVVFGFTGAFRYRIEGMALTFLGNVSCRKLTALGLALLADKQDFMV